MNPTAVKYFFKKRKEKDANGLVLKEIPAPEPLEISIPLLTMEDVVALIQSNNEKVHSLILESLNNVIIDQVRAEVNDDVEGVREKGVAADTYDFVKIAELPPATRRGSAIPDEVWEGFIKDYTEVMQHHGKTAEKAAMGAKLLKQKFQPVKSNKKVIKALKENLQTYFTNTEKAEEFQQVYETLSSKADTLLEADEDALLAAV
jgi:hypothetical protein